VIENGLAFFETIKLIAISNVRVCGWKPMVERFERLCRLARPGTVLVLLRDPELSVRERLILGEQLRDVTYKTSQRLSVRDRLDLAHILDSDGVHLSENGLSPERVREAVGSRFFVSKAVHSLDWMPSEAVDAAIVSPVCAPRKTNLAIGLEGLGKFTRRSPNVPVFALGGIDESSARACLHAGAFGVAAIGSVLSTDDPRGLLDALGVLKA
jgi:thiamine-phosphate pyrophosphorylase